MSLYVGMGAVINATFGSIVEIILYWMAIVRGKGALVEGSIIGSFLGSMLLLPGASMVAGGVGKWKEQRFNVKSAGVSTVLLIMALIGAFSPTLFYQTFGTHELYCAECPSQAPPAFGMASGDQSTPTPQHTPATDLLLRCRGCQFRLPKNPGSDAFYITHVRPFMYLCAAILPTAYLIGLWFTLRTHVHQIYSSGQQDGGHQRQSMMSVRRSQHQPLRPSQILSIHSDHVPNSAASGTAAAHAPISRQNSARRSVNRNSMTPQITPHAMPTQGNHAPPAIPPLTPDDAIHTQDDHGGGSGGHDAPEWSKWKSTVVLLVSTVMFSMLAELLVDAADEVIKESGIDQKFLGLTLFALVPNVTEFMNAIAFAMYGNVALSLEIGSAYTVQVALLQIPSLVAFSGVRNHFWGVPDTVEQSFTLIFPQWDLYSVFFSVFLLSYTYIEGRSNYFKGSILCLSYFTLVLSFYFATL